MTDRKMLPASVSLTSCMRSYIDRMVALPGMKALIMDKDTTKMLGLVFSLTTALSKQIYLVERLGAPERKGTAKDAATTQHLKAVVFVRPTQQSVQTLCQCLARPKYREYHIFFSNLLSEEFLRTLAEADEHNVVMQVQEYYADFLALDQNVLSLDLYQTIQLHSARKSWGSPQRQMFERMVNGVLSVMLANKRRPVIRHSGRSQLCHHLATTLNARMAHEGDLFQFRQSCLLLVLDRKDDPVTPLLTQWTYQAMLHECLGIKDNRIDMTNVNSKDSKELSEVVLAAHEDDFFRRSMYLNFGDLGISVKKLVADWQKKQTSTKTDMKSIADMQKFLSNFPEFKREAGNVSKHVTVISELSRQTNAYNLLDVSELEQELACNQAHSEHLQTLLSLMDDSKVQFANKLRCVLLYMLRYEKQSNQVGQFLRILNDRARTAEQRQQVHAVEAMRAYAGADHRTGDLFENKSFFAQMKKAMSSGLQGVENIYTQHKPFIAKILEDLNKGQLKTQDYPFVGTGARKTFDTVIIFMVGGATYEEAFYLNTLNQASRNTRYILGGTCVHNSSSFLKDLLHNAGQHNVSISFD